MRVERSLSPRRVYITSQRIRSQRKKAVDICMPAAYTQAYDNELHHRIRTMRYKPSPVSKHMLARFTGSYLLPEGRPGFLAPAPQWRASWVSSVYSSGGGVRRPQAAAIYMEIHTPNASPTNRRDDRGRKPARRARARRGASF